VRLDHSGALEVKYQSTNPDGIERETRRLKAMGLEEGRHFAVRAPEEDGKAGFVSILKEGLERAARLSIHGSGEQQRLAAEFVEYILQRAREGGDDVYKKALEVVEEGRARGSLKLTDIKGRKVYVEGRRHVVTVLGGGAQSEEGRSGKTLLRIAITAEVDGVRRDYTMAFGRYGTNNKAVSYAYAKADVAERFSALIKALTGEEPGVYRRSDGTIVIVCYEGHLKGFMRYAELADAIMKWLEETSR